MHTISYKKEILRKLIHLSSLWMPVAIYVLPWAVSIALFATLMTFMIIYENFKTVRTGFIGKLNACLAPIMRSHEQGRFQLTGATYMVFAALICCVIFPKLITVTALCIMLICDTAASLVGRLFSKNKLFGKSLEGLFAFISTGLFVILCLSWVNTSFPRFNAGMVAVIIAALVELISAKIRLDDNLSVTLTAATVLWLMH